MNLTKFLKKESDKFRNALELISEKKFAWNDFEEKAVIQFNDICKEAIVQKLFEKIYVNNSKKYSNELSSQTPFVTLFWGKHITGEINFKNKNELVIEEGCALHYTQLLSGKVCVVFYPFKSELNYPNKNFYIYKIFSSPKNINETSLNKHVKLLFSYAHYSSYMGTSDFIDWYRMKCLQIRSKLREIWHSDWIVIVFGQVQKSIEKQINGFVNIDDRTSDNN